MKAVAIYGFSAFTRHLIHESTADEVWTLNDAYNHGVPMDRVTRWYELHKSSYLNTKEGHYKDFLGEKHPFPIYMQNADEQFLSSVTYPLDEISQYIDDGRRYFTSTMAYMIAHAIYDRYDRIELYGIDLSFGTEYEYQKACVEYMIALAVARGISVYIPPGCSILNAPLYGYESNGLSATVEVMREHQAHYKTQYDKVDSNMSLVYDGAQAMIELLINKYTFEGNIDKHMLEIRETYLWNTLLDVNRRYNYMVGRNSSVELISDEMKAEHENLYTQMLQLDGGLQAIANLISHMIGRTYNLNLVMSIKD